MDLKKIQDANVRNKKVLLRADFNVAIANGRAKETFKIAAAKETLDYLSSQGARVALVSHLGRPDGKPNLEFSMEQLVQDAENILGRKIIFIPDCVGEKVKNGLEKMREDEVLLLENVRFYEGEETNDESFAKRLAENFDIYINDAFSVSHRDQASVTGVTKFLPSYAGLRLQKEISEMEKIQNNPGHPAVAIIGGAKIETKLPVIKFFENGYEHVLVGGKIANEAIDQKIEFQSGKVVLPSDFLGDRFDIGPDTIKKFKDIISQAKTVVWNGPVGKFEEAPYDTGTKEVLQAIIASGAYSVLGGGESVEILEKNNAMDKISFVSTGGGAMLEYLSDNPMPGIEVLVK